MIIDFTNALENSIGEFGVKKEDIIKNNKFLFRVKENIVRKELSDYYPLLLPNRILEQTKEINEFANQLKRNLIILL